MECNDQTNFFIRFINLHIILIYVNNKNINNTFHNVNVPYSSRFKKNINITKYCHLLFKIDVIDSLHELLADGNSYIGHSINYNFQ